MQQKLEQLAAWRTKSAAGGGEQRVTQQRASGKGTARQRLASLLDPGSFQEIDSFVRQHTGNGVPDDPIGEGVVTGWGRIHGRPVFCFSQDFTIYGGSVGELHSRKICKIMDLAYRAGAPIVGINDSGGARIQEGVDALGAYGEIFARNARLSGVVPQISVILGPCAGGAVYSPALTDFTFVADRVSKMFITGPQVTKAATGEDVTFEELGGAETHASKSGVAHFRAPSEEECLAMVRDLLSYLPSNNLETPPVTEPSEPPGHPDELLDVVPTSPNKAYDVRQVLWRVLDGGRLLEVHQEFALNAVAGFGRMAGQVVGVIANQPRVLAGCLDIDASDKIARFVRFCDAFNIPLVTFVDVPGFLPGVAQEHRGIIRHGAKILYAYAEATVPKIAVILRKAYGGAYVAMSSRGIGADLALAWPTAEVAVMGPEGAAQILYRNGLAHAEDPQALLAERTREYRDRYANPYVACARGMVDDVIDPRETRPRIIHALAALANKREDRPPKKHGNIPL
ncbi:MAG: methylmalonyl-CoA carboxyltransferase [Firmicutes bacterium ZCTH02-B6]|nr:MAG: methylmalonyl-CoA carboxyltransferase [Firmicutes bacterium ZCTH02-B6]